MIAYPTYSRYQLSGLPVALSIVLMTASACSPNALPVTLGEVVALDPYGIGANGNLTSFDRPWEDEELLAAFEDLGLRHIRYPAGTLGNYWDWDEGWIDADVPDSLMIPWVVRDSIRHRPSRYTLENLALVTERTSAVPIFMLNMLSKDLEHSLSNLRRARDLGMPVRYVELGNELYFDLPFPKRRYPTPEDYGRTCERWIRALKAEFPAARFAVIGSYLRRHPRQQDWTRRVMGECPSADAITYHVYTPSGLDGRMVKRDPTPGEEGVGNPHSITRNPPPDPVERQGWERKQLEDPAAFTNLLTTARRGATGWRKMDAPEDTDIWATEFNMRDDSSVVLGSWAQSLLLSVYFGEFYRSPVSVATIHNLVGPMFGLLYTDPRQTDYLLDRPKDVKMYAPTAAGIITGLFARTGANADRCTPLDYPTAAVLTDDRGEGFPSVQGFLFDGAERTALLINYGFTTLTVAVPEVLHSCRAYTYRAPLDRTLMGWDEVDSTTTYVSDGKLTLPPGSVTQLMAYP